MEIEHGTGWVRLDLTGDIDAMWFEQNGAEVRAVFDGRPKEFVVDVDSVTFMDSSGLGLIARCVKESQAQQGAVYLVGANPIVRSLVDMIGLTQLVTIVETPAEKGELNQRLGLGSPDPSLS